jgi:hypothetical protein
MLHRQVKLLDFVSNLDPDTFSAKVNLTIKSAKPPASFEISVSPTDTIAAIKDVIAACPGGPPVDVQRLLFKGKALADAKLLKEYTISDGDTVNIMTKPGYVWSSSPQKDATSVPPPAPEVRKPANLAIPTPMAVDNTRPSHSGSGSRSHSRSNSANIPDLVLSPTPRSTSPNTTEASQPVLLTVDTSTVSTPSSQSAATITSYQHTLSQPPFWQHLHAFLQKEFDHREDAATAFEDFLLASKGNLTAHQIAAIRDAVGVLGMGGT